MDHQTNRAHAGLMLSLIVASVGCSNPGPTQSLPAAGVGVVGMVPSASASSPGGRGSLGGSGAPAAVGGGATGSLVGGSGATAVTAGTFAPPDADDAGLAPPDVSAPLQGPFSAAELQAQHCDPSRPAFAYRASLAGASRAERASEGALAAIPCATYTEIGSTESSLGVSRDGSVYYAPAYTNDAVGLLRSRDQGQSWQFIAPKLSNGGTHGRMQPYLYIDPTTDRIFFATTASNAPDPVYQEGFDLSISSDGADSFESLNLATDTFDWVKIFAGPPVTSTTAGYPNIVYASAPSPISTPIPIASLIGLAPQYQSINRSLDGGKTWERVATPSLLAEDVPGCAAANEWLIYGVGAVDPRGRAYLVLRRCRKLAVAVSGDEGSNWTIHELPNAALPPFDTSNLLQIVANPNLLVTEQLTLDSAGNVYVAWIDDQGSLRLAISRDQAETWSPSVAVAAPEVTDVRYAGLATREPGVLAIAYYGSRDGVQYNGYVSETLDAFASEPVFSSVVINDPADPLFAWGFEVGYLGVTEGADLNEIVQVKYAPNGDLWTSMVKDMCESATTTRCHWDIDAHAKSPYQGVVGRVVHGVSERWSDTRPVDPNRHAITCEQNEANAMMCGGIATSENICQELASCACTNCACTFLECRKDPACDAVRRCATQNNCRGIDCIVACQGIALESGELMTSRALEVATCLSSNSCPASCPPF